VLPAAGAVSPHHGDLDRFFRNVHQGLRGILARRRASPGSEFSLRRCLDEVSRWSQEAATGAEPLPTRECRLFLVDRLLRALRSLTDGVKPPLAGRLPAIGSELGIADRLAVVTAWLERIEEPALAGYASIARLHARYLRRIFNGRPRA
jgi:hypothetical protein